MGFTSPEFFGKSPTEGLDLRSSFGVQGPKISVLGFRG